MEVLAYAVAPVTLFLLPSPQLYGSVTPLAWDCPTFPRKRCMAGVGTLCIQPSLPTPDLLSLCPLPQCRLQPIWRELCRVPSRQLSPLPCRKPLMHCLREGHSKGNCALLQCIYFFSLRKYPPKSNTMNRITTTLKLRNGILRT